MTKQEAGRKGQAFQATISVAGIGLWVFALASLSASYTLRERLTLLTLTALAAVVGMFPITFPLPSKLRLTHEKINFTLSDALIFLVACWHGLLPAVVVAGVEGFSGSRRAVRRLSSNLFSFGMMSLAAAGAAICLQAVLRYGFGEDGSHEPAFLAVATALLAASIVHLLVNVGLLSTLLALRHGSSISTTWKENLLWAVPMFIPTSTAASLVYLALQHGALLMSVVGVPILVAIYFGHRQFRDRVEERVGLIERAAQERIELMEKAHRETIEALAVAINAKDAVTHEHVLRVQIYSAGVARLLGCSEAEVEALRAGALLHDIGKIAVPDYILNKPGKLTAAEFDQMKLHTVVGAQILGRVDFPYPVAPVVRSHHERWDGKGYPDGLKGEEIPLTARILSVVDCFDAVREDRQYRKGMTREEAINFIMQGSGSMYDPRVVGTFITHLPEFEAEIMAQREAPLPTFGIEPTEQLSAAALAVAPAAGLAAETEAPGAQQNGGLTLQAQGELEALAQSLRDARETVERVGLFTDKLRALVSYDLCTVTLVARETGAHTVAHARGEHAELLEGRRIAPGEGVTGWVLANRKPFCNTDPKLDLPHALTTLFADYRTLAAHPIIHETELHGAVTLYSSSLESYSPAQQELLARAVAHLAAALSSEIRSTTEELKHVAHGGSTQVILASGLTH